MSIRITYNADMMKIMSLFENITHTQLKDTFVDDNSLLTFIVKEGQIKKAVGKKAENVKKLERLLNRKIKIVEFNPLIESFINNLIFPLKIKNIDNFEDIITVEAEDIKTRGIIIGRNAKNLRNIENIAKTYFPNLKEIKVK